jgi:outer membrane lipoprotein SlyB
MTTTVVGVFNSEASAQTAVNELRTAGVPMDRISVIARPAGDIVNESGEVINVAAEDHMTAGEGLTVGAVWGGLVGLAALAIPGIGPLVTSNIFAAALTGAVAGAATGGIAGALIDAASVPEEHARVYEDRVRTGGTLVTAQVDDGMAMQARSILQTAGAEDFNWEDPNTFGSRTDVVDTDDQAYAESSKVGTVGGGAAGAITGAAIGAAGGPVGAVIGGVAGAVAGGTVGAVGDTIGEKSEDAMYGDAHRTANSVDYDAATEPNYGARMDADLNRLDEAGYVAGGLRSNYSDTTIDDDYADSSKVGTVGGGAAGALTGAAIGAAGGPVGAVIGGVAGAMAGGAVGAAGDTLGEKAEDAVQGDTTPNDTGYGNRVTSADYRSTSTVTSSDSYVADRTRDALTDNQGDDTFRTADQAYDESSKVGTGGGALAGAATGAAIGSVGGPVGTVIGGVAGAISGAAAGAVGDTIGKEAETETGAFSDANKNQYRSAGEKVADKAADAGNAVERGLDADLNRDGDVGRRG